MRITERQFIEKLRRAASRRRASTSGGVVLRQGIGDDCAILSQTGVADLLITTDLFLEDVHFRSRWQPPESLGHKTLARGLSDIAAMGGRPRYCFLSLGIPRGVNSKWMNRFFAGFFRLAEAHGVSLAGGDTAASKSGFLADIMVVGEVPSGKAVLRSSAEPGDEIWVTGHLGGAAVALDRLQKGKRSTGSKKIFRQLFYPQPRVAIGQWLRRRGIATAMIDLSDGLSIDLARLCHASGVGARIDADAVPRLRTTPLEQALHGGEDFELLFTVPTNRARKLPAAVDGVPLTRIGEILRGTRLRTVRSGKEDDLPVRGFEHF